MKKKEAVHIICECAKLYSQNLENTNLRFVYGDVDAPLIFDVVFLPRNFQHLTGVKASPNGPQSCIQFYQRCLSRHLSDNDIMFAGNGTTQLKLEVLPTLLKNKIGATMIGDYNNSRSKKLVTSKLVGTITACMGFVLDDNSDMYVPNTVLKTDMSYIVQGSTTRILGALQKNIREEMYSQFLYKAEGVPKNIILLYQ